MTYSRFKYKLRRILRKAGCIPKIIVVLSFVMLLAAGLFIRYCSYPATYDGRRENHAEDLDFKARNFFHKGMTDSAVVYFTRLTDFHDVPDATAAERELACHAHTSMGTIYTNFYCDYPTAMHHLLRADSIARQYGMEKELCNIYLARTNLQFDLLNMEGNFSYSPELCGMFFNAFRQARKINNLYLENIAFVNLAYLLMKHNRASDMKGEVELLQKDFCRYRADSLRNPHAKRVFPDSLILTGYMSGISKGIESFISGDNEKALHYFGQLPGETVKLNPNTRTRYDFISATCRYATLVKMGRSAEASAVLDTIYVRAQKVNVPSLQLEALNMLLLHHKNDSARLFRYELEFFKKKDEFTRHARVAKVRSMELKKELDDTHSRISADRQRYNVILWLLGIVVIASLGLLALLVWLNGKYKVEKLKNYRLYRRVSQSLNRNPETKEGAVSSKYARNRMPDDRRKAIAEAVTDTFENNPEIFDSEFSLKRLSEIVGCNANDVSQVINLSWNKNFNALLAEYRIREACRRLAPGSDFSNMTVEAVAASVGIRSRSNFSKLFKQVVGLSPSVYMRISKENAPG